MNNTRNTIIKYVKIAGSVLITFFTTVFSPLLITLLIKASDDSQYELKRYLEITEFLTPPLMIIGSMITILVFLSFFIERYKLTWLLFSIFPEVLFIFFLLVFSLFFNIIIFGDNSIATINLTVSFGFFITIPLIIIARNICIYLITRREFFEKAIVLYTINSTHGSFSIKNGRKILSKLSKNPILRIRLLRNYAIIMESLEKEGYLIGKSQYLRLSENGVKLLHYFEDSKNFILNWQATSIERPSVELRVWTEKALKKDALIRKLRLNGIFSFLKRK